MFDVFAGTDTFPAGGFDSLSAVELSSTVSTALGMQLPGTLVFDYPSVSAMAQYIHSLLAPAQQANNNNSGSSTVGSELVTTLSGLGPADNAPASSQLISIALASRLPTGYSGTAGELVAGDTDGISMVPYGRWDLEGLRVSHTSAVWLLPGVPARTYKCCILDVFAAVVAAALLD